MIRSACLRDAAIQNTDVLDIMSVRLFGDIGNLKLANL